MSAPFIIWTLQRTGGTTLAHLLISLSQSPTLGHEPFNPDRRLGGLHKAFLETRDEEALRAGIRTALAGAGSMKHCHELVPPRLNEILMEETTAAGWTAVILDRQNDSARMLSLITAQLTGAWGKALADQVVRDCEAGTRVLPPADLEAARRGLWNGWQRRRHLAAAFADRGLRPEVVLFEEVYDDPDRGAELVADLIARLGIGGATAAPPDPRLPDPRILAALKNSGQNSNRILNYLPNIAELRAALRETEARLLFSWRAPGETGG
ncbi:hypothetical protein ACFOHK_19910 [Falsigemmobacter intermedius]|uniref:Sulphotransferase Stf0 domain-containing protein n=1 Tax=Falsigemmobacter intermedius TaxID=1553448 RepID=A0A444M919_9RHOB|nr:hypothetical protein [Falsigemmobacter intermedius]RWY39179.1 hypothetical protein EP867_14510 [Falsigemmobacter intermedius]